VLLFIAELGRLQSLLTASNTALAEEQMKSVSMESSTNILKV